MKKFSERRFKAILSIVVLFISCLTFNFISQPIIYAQSNVSLDASTPASSWPGTGSGSVTSNSFTPPAGSIILALAEADSNTSMTWTTSISDNLTNHLTWHKAIEQNGADGWSTVFAYWAFVGSNSPGPMTITVLTNGGAAGAIWLTPMVIDGADISNPIGSIISGSLPATSTSLNESITPTTVGSALVGAAIQPYGGTFSAGLNNYIYALAPNPHLASYYIGTSSGFTNTVNLNPQSFLINSSATNAYDWAYLGLEIVPQPVINTQSTTNSTPPQPPPLNQIVHPPNTGYGKPTQISVWMVVSATIGLMTLTTGTLSLLLTRRRKSLPYYLVNRFTL